MRIIAHKLYQSIRINSVPCIAIDLGYKIVNNDHSYDLTDLQLQQLSENLGAVRKAKNDSCEFGSLLVCIFFYAQNSYPIVDF